MTCRSIMTPEPISLAPADRIGPAAKIILERRFIHLPVVDAGRYVGCFGVFELLGLLLPSAAIDRLLPDLRFLPDDPADLIRRLGEVAEKPVGPHVRTDLPVLHPETSVVEALLLFHRHRATLPVVEAERLVGILSYWDALKAIAEAAR